MSEVNRRTLLRGAVYTGAIGTVGPLLGACASDGGGGTGSGYGGGSGGSGDGSDSASKAPSTPAESPSSSAPEQGGGEAIATTSQIPVGGGKVIDQKYVVTQPTKGEFVGFSAICTHQGCPVGEVARGTINCFCHGSMYKVEDGSVTTGPATAPLKKQPITVEGDQITLA